MADSDASDSSGRGRRPVTKRRLSRVRSESSEDEFHGSGSEQSDDLQSSASSDDDAGNSSDASEKGKRQSSKAASKRPKGAAKPVQRAQTAQQRRMKSITSGGSSAAASRASTGKRSIAAASGSSEDEFSGSDSDSIEVLTAADTSPAAAGRRTVSKAKAGGGRRPRAAAASASASSASASSSSSSSSASTSRAMKATTVAPVQVMAGVRLLRARVEKELTSGGAKPTLAALGILAVTEVRELPPIAVMSAIEGIFAEAASTILAEQGFKFEVPNRTASNQLYVPELDRIVLKDKKSTRSFESTAQVRKTVIMTRVMDMLHQVLRRNIHTTKRDLFYADVKLFKTQDESDAVLDDVACVVGCTRTSLHVVASEKGVVVGRVKFREDGDLIDCTRMGVGGKAIPPFIDKIADFESDAEFILLVEKDAAFMRLAEDRFYNKYPCIIITAKGQPDVATRLFLRKCRDDLKLPVLALVDADPYGLKIISVYMSGSKTMSYDSASLTTSDIKWLGVRPSDLDKYSIPEQCRLPMTASDIKYGKALLEEEFVKRNPQWHAELKAMLSSKVKAEIQALSSYGFQYLTETYLPRKLAERDWI